MPHPAGPASSPGNTPGAANRQGNASQGRGNQGAKDPDVRNLGVDGGLPKPDSVRRTLSGGEWFALLLLGVALVFCLVLGVGLAWLRGTELVREPSWWPALESLESSQPDPGSLAVPQPTLPQPTLPQSTAPPSLGPSLQTTSWQAPSLP